MPDLTPAQACAALLILALGVAALCLAFLSLAEGYGWSSAPFAVGGFAVVVWSVVRLVPARGY